VKITTKIVCGPIGSDCKMDDKGNFVPVAPKK